MNIIYFKRNEKIEAIVAENLHTASERKSNHTKMAFQIFNKEAFFFQITKKILKKILKINPNICKESKILVFDIEFSLFNI